jgi:hypothetical protein
VELWAVGCHRPLEQTLKSERAPVVRDHSRRRSGRPAAARAARPLSRP